MYYGSKESWNIARDQEEKSLEILWQKFEIFWIKNVKIYNLTRLNTLVSDCLNSLHFPAKQEHFNWLGYSRHRNS